MQVTLGKIIAHRYLVVVGTQSEPDRRVTISLGSPQPVSDSADFYCPYRITGFETDCLRYACGVDGFQAIQLALNMIAVELSLRKQEFGDRLRWEAGAEGDLGFPEASALLFDDQK